MLYATSRPGQLTAPMALRRVWVRVRTAMESLRLRLTLGAMLLMVGVLATAGYLLDQQAVSQTLRATERREVDEVARVAQLLSHDLLKKQRVLALAAESLSRLRSTSAEESMRFLNGQKALLGTFSSVFIAKSEGQVLALLDEKGERTTDINLEDRGYFRSTVAEARPIISDVIQSRAGAGPLVVFSHPIVLDGRVRLVLGAGLRLADRGVLSDVVGDVGPETEDTAQLMVSDGSGQIIAHSDANWLMRAISQEPAVNESWVKWLGMGGPLEPSGVTVNGRDHLVCVAAVESTGWLVWRVHNRLEVTQPLLAARKRVALSISVIAALACLALLLWVRFLLLPLAALEKRALHLFDQDMSAPDNPPSYSGEIGHLARVLHHVAAERAQLESFNEEIVRKLRSVMNAAPVGIAFTRHRRFELVSSEFCRIFGWSENEAGGREANTIYASNEDYAALGPLVREAFQKSGDYVGEWRMLRQDGTAFWGQLRGRPVDPADPNHGTIWSIVDVTQQVTDRESLEWSASHDPLTGLGNRKYFHARAQRLLDTSPEATPAALIAIDLDHFKPVNDTAGHAAGDAMLRAVAMVITTAVRGQDLVARLGGDEFAILLDHCREATAAKIAEKIGTAIRAHVLTWEGHSFSVGASLGIAILRPDIRTPEAWLELADAACYSAKQAGRGRVMFPTAVSGLRQ